MKTIVLLMATLINLSAYAYEYKCSNNDVTIEIVGSTQIEEVSFYSDDPKAIFKNDYKYIISEKGVDAKTFSIVAASSDGAGQEAFEVFDLDRDLSPLKNVASFYFEHEGGCLDGNYFSFKQDKWISIDACWGDSPNRLMCEDGY